MIGATILGTHWKLLQHHKRLVMAQKEWKSERHSTRYYDCHQPATWDKSWRKVEWADKSKGGHQWHV